jgi:predicted DNA-binding transcriptional regulator AlpA
MSTIDRMEKNGEFPKRFWITDKRCAWNSEEIELAGRTSAERHNGVCWKKASG